MYLHTFLVAFVGASIPLVSAYLLLPTKLGEKLFAHHLERKLAALRHEHDTALEELSATLAHLGDRAIRSNEKEFDALRTLWDAFNDTYSAAYVCGIGLVEHVDMRFMSDIDAVRYLEAFELTERQRQKVSEASPSDRNRVLSDYLQQKLISEARKSIYDFHSLMWKQAIFVPEPLFASFSAFLSKLNTLCAHRRTERNYGELSGRSVEWLTSDSEKERNALMVQVRGQLPAIRVKQA